MNEIRLIVLGNPSAGDDGAAFAAADLVRAPVQQVRAGRPGAGLLDLLDGPSPVVLADVTQGLGAPGDVTRGRLNELADRLDARGQLSSHGFGPAEALRLAMALGRTLPPIECVGLEGRAFDPGTALTPAVERALPAFAAAIDEAVTELRAETSASPPAESEGANGA